MRGDAGTPLARITALDGVRAVAVVAVLAFHGGAGALASGGFLGVDAFFVLSGFLITGILLTDGERAGRVRLLRFWGRRVRRLMPALLVVVAAVAVVFGRIVPPEELGLLRTDVLATLGYVANWWLISRDDGGYFAATADPSPLQHTWSLAIEEQFYLAWPLVIAAVIACTASKPARAILRRRLIMGVSVAGIAASAVAMAALAHGPDPSRAYYGSDTRAGALFVGCALAALLSGRIGAWRTRPLRFAALVSATWLAWAWTHADGSALWLYRGGLFVCAIAVAVIIAAVVCDPGGPADRVLAMPPLPQIGLVSYGIYLWHWPVFQFLDGERTTLAGTELFGLRCAVTLALAAVSYVVVERPVRRGLPVRPRLRPAIAVGALVAVAAVGIVATIAPTASVPPPSAAVAAAPMRPSRPTSVLTRPGRLPGPPRVAIFGDSVADSLGDHLPPVPGLQIRNAGLAGCGISPSGVVRDGDSVHGPYEGCVDWEGIWAARLRAYRPDVAVVLLGRWEVMDRRFAGRWRTIDDPLVRTYLAAQLDRVVRLLTSHGARLLLCTYPTSRRYERPDGGLYPEDTPGRAASWNRIVREVGERYPQEVTVVDLAERMTPGGRYRSRADGVLLRSDGLHFTVAGVRRWITPWLVPHVQAELTEPAAALSLTR